NSGTVDVQTGTIVLAATNHHLKQGGTFRGNGRLRVTDVAVTLDGMSTLDPKATIELTSGALDGAGGFVGSGTIEWTGGEIRGTLTMAKGTHFAIRGDGGKVLPGGTINLAGATVWTGAGAITGYSDGRINNSGFFDAQSDATFNFCCAG